MNKRNGKIDFLRFVFALFIMFLHYKWQPIVSIGNISLSLGQRGDFGVVFFFVLSGYLLTKKAERLSLDLNTKFSPTENAMFIKSKYLYYINWYLVAFISHVIFNFISNGVVYTLKNVLRSVQNLLLLGSLGFSSDERSIGFYVGASWFLSALFISQIIIYPFMRYNYKYWIGVVSPILFMVLLAIKVHGYGGPIVRALMCIVLGGFCYEITKKVNQIEITMMRQTVIRVIELSIWVLCIIYMCSNPGDDMEYSMMFIVALGIVLSFSNITYYRLFDNYFFSYLGKLSFPLYLLHIQVLDWGIYLMNVMNVRLYDYIMYPMLYLVAVIISILALFVSERILVKKRMAL